jgi:hypothetical protein
MLITLSWPEVMCAVSTGTLRHIAALRKGLPDCHGFKGEDGWTIHIEGAAGEMAFAKAAGRYYASPVNTFKEGGDVGDVQVRTRSRMDYDLLVRPSDRDRDVFVLVLGKIPTFDVVGWMRGSDAKNEKWLNAHGNRPPAYFVPRSELSPIETLNPSAV